MGANRTNEEFSLRANRCIRAAERRARKKDDPLVYEYAFDGLLVEGPVEVADLDSLYQAAQESDQDSSEEASSGGASAKWDCRMALIRRMFDLSLVPRSQSRSTGRFPSKKFWPDWTHRMKALGRGPRCFFLDPRSADENRDSLGRDSLTDVDAFASYISDSNEADGVHAIAGMRGSGKTTLLNRIESFCEHRIDGTGGAPLVVRFDLSPSFDDSKFTVDLVREVGRRAVEQVNPSIPWYRLAPQTLGARGAWQWSVRAFVGYVGDWCSCNAVWAIMAIAGLAIYRVLFDSATTGAAKTTSTNGPPNDLIVNVGWLALCVLIVASFNQLGLLLRTEVAKRWGYGHTSRRLLTLGFAVSASGVAVHVWLNQSPQVLFEAKVPMIPGIALILAGLTLGLPPVWWESYLKLNALRRVGPDSKGGGPLDLATLGSSFAPVGMLIRSLMPNADNPDRLETMSISFLQDRLKAVLREAVNVFGRVIVLIDDVDAVGVMKGDPSREQDHVLLCLLRPLSKITGVRVVVAVPDRYFDLRDADLDDFHSTCRGLRLLGDSRLFQRSTTNKVKVEGDVRAMTQKILRDTLVARLRARVRNPEECVNARAITAILSVWDAWMKSDESLKTLRSAYLKIGASRRELLREIERVLEANRSDLNPSDLDSSDPRTPFYRFFKKTPKVPEAPTLRASTAIGS